MKKLHLGFFLGLSLVTLTYSGCETPGQGAGVGAATGAVIGGLVTGRPGGVVAGAVAGAVTGAALGQQAEDERLGYAGPPPYRYRFARLTMHDGFVRSPYPPYAVIDVRGFPPGARVRDPVSHRVFILP